MRIVGKIGQLKYLVFSFGKVLDKYQKTGTTYINAMEDRESTAYGEVLK